MHHVEQIFHIFLNQNKHQQWWVQLNKQTTDTHTHIIITWYIVTSTPITYKAHSHTYPQMLLCCVNIDLVRPPLTRIRIRIHLRLKNCRWRSVAWWCNRNSNSNSTVVDQIIHCQICRERKEITICTQNSQVSIWFQKHAMMALMQLQQKKKWVELGLHPSTANPNRCHERRLDRWLDRDTIAYLDFGVLFLCAEIGPATAGEMMKWHGVCSDWQIHL